MTLMAGDLLGGRYRLTERLSQGSSGVVWRADEILRGNPIAQVAVKVFTVEINYSEIEALARLQHGHILSYRTVVEHEGRLCLVTEFADGGDLAQMLKAYPDGLPLARVREVVVSTALALRYLHEQAWVHRDVKPSNILYVGTVPKLGDVGTAKAVGGAMTRHTGVGSIAYSAPETFSGQVGPPSDVYALGVTAFELLTGRLPFDGAPEEVMRQHLHREPTLPGEIPDAFAAFLAGALRKQPDRRLGIAEVLELMQPQAPASAAAPRPAPFSSAEPSLPTSAPTPAPSAPRMKPEQVAAEMTRHIRSHLLRHDSRWDSPAVWGGFWQELKQLGQQLRLTDADLMGQVQALRNEMAPPAPAPARTRAAPSPQATKAAAKPAPPPQAAKPAVEPGPAPPPKAPPRATPPKSPAPPALRHGLIELIQRYGDHWSLSDVWQPFWSKLQQTSPGMKERDAIELGEELERQLAELDRQQQRMQTLVVQWVTALGSRRWIAKDWLRLLDSLQQEGLSDEPLATRYRDEAIERIFPQQVGSLRRLKVHGELSCELVYLDQRLLASSATLSDLADSVFSKEEHQAGKRAADAAPKGIWISLAPITIAQWYGLLQHPLPGSATKPEATARVLLQGIQTELLPRLQRRFPIENLRMATRAESHVLRSQLKPPAEKTRPTPGGDAPAGQSTVWSLLGRAAVEVLAQVAEENQEWFHNETAAASEARATRKPFRLVSVVPA